MIKQDDYEGMAYYYYELDGQAEFGKVWVFPKYNKNSTRGIFPIEAYYFFGYNTNFFGMENRISSNQLNGEGGLSNFYLSLNELADKRKMIIKTIFDATKDYARDSNG